MADLIYTDRDGIESGILTDYSLDLAFGSSENDFELETSEVIPRGGFVYMDGTEYGGIIDSWEVDETGAAPVIKYRGRTWHGILDERVIRPASGQAYRTYSGTPQEVIAGVIADTGLGDMFEAGSGNSTPQEPVVTYEPYPYDIFSIAKYGDLSAVDDTIYSDRSTSNVNTNLTIYCYSTDSPSTYPVGQAISQAYNKISSLQSTNTLMYMSGDNMTVAEMVAAGVSPSSSWAVYKLEHRKGDPMLDKPIVTLPGDTISGRFDRYCTVLDGLWKELGENGLRLDFRKNAGGKCVVSAVAVESYAGEVYSDQFPLNIEEAVRNVNHLVCLGNGELQDRQVIDLYADKRGNVSRVQTIFGMEERVEVYSNPSEGEATEETYSELLKSGTEKLEDYQAQGSVKLTVREGFEGHVGDMVSAVSTTTGATVTAKVTKAIVKADQDTLFVEYEVGNEGNSSSGSSGGSGGSSGSGGGASSGGAVDLTGYATEAWVEGKGYALASAIPTDNAQLANGAGYLTSHQSLAGYATEAFVTGKGYITQTAMEQYVQSLDGDGRSY